ncbi:MAG: NeuD/PglB/VioB family sugar acetyltransferase [Devosia sp.]
MLASCMPNTVLFGAGGHAKVVIDTMRHSGMGQPVACLARGSDHPALLGIEVMDEAMLGTLRAQGVTHACIAVGDATLRARLAADALAGGLALLTVISSRAYVADSVVVGAGVVICAGAVVQPDSRLDRLTIVNSAASIDHDSHVGELCHIAPGSVLCGNVTIGKRCWIGAGAVVIEHRSIADDVFVAAGAVVVKDAIHSGVRLAGVPARAMSEMHYQDTEPHV